MNATNNSLSAGDLWTTPDVLAGGELFLDPRGGSEVSIPLQVILEAGLKVLMPTATPARVAANVGMIMEAWWGREVSLEELTLELAKQKAVRGQRIDVLPVNVASNEPNFVCDKGTDHD